ncbi:cytidylyltransferase domain-containing protein [Tardiphaga sp. vice278]|uniref:cytidylyltransferase domain-containing protein n=1 Tax=Tardiphaga sp. vice278 TaxID=2592815 RepID=UPI00143DD3AD|nr:hypothetical protein [Tardiphaga sp. vice278]
MLARTESKRLPGKALCDLNGQPLIQYAFDTCRATPGIDITVLATTDRPEDDRLADYAASQAVPCFRGSQDDVAGRFLGAMEAFALVGAVRFNGDSPLNTPGVLAEAVSLFRTGDWDLITNVPGRTYPFGASAEVVSIDIMRAACAAMVSAAHREHVTKLFYDEPAFARTCRMTAGTPGMAGVQLAVDSPGDLDRVAWILQQLNGPLAETPLEVLVDLARAYDAAK